MNLWVIFWLKFDKSEQITPLLKQVYWLSITIRIENKILVLAYKVLYGNRPEYLKELLVVHIGHDPPKMPLHFLNLGLSLQWVVIALLRQHQSFGTIYHYHLN